APRTEVEALLAGIWGDVLCLDAVGVDDAFFEIGGHSLLATAVGSRVRETFGVQGLLRALFGRPTVAGMAERVGARPGAGTGGGPELVASPREGPAPLSWGQRGLWFLEQLEPGFGTYEMSWGFRLRGELDVVALERALGEVVRRHEVLRTRFERRGEE